MKPFSIAAAYLSLVSTAIGVTAEAPRTSKVQLPAEFKPPQVFKNTNLVQIISAEKNYVKQQINVHIENVATKPQDEYFVPFTFEQLSRVGGFEVKDRKDDGLVFTSEIVEYDATRLVTKISRVTKGQSC